MAEAVGECFKRETVLLSQKEMHAANCTRFSTYWGFPVEDCMLFVTDECLFYKLAACLATSRRSGWGIRTCRLRLATPISATSTNAKLPMLSGSQWKKNCRMVPMVPLLRIKKEFPALANVLNSLGIVGRPWQTILELFSSPLPRAH
jgi:hypothetical protein